MLTSECWIAYHDNCPVPGWCDCLCHAELAELMEELGEGSNEA